LRLCRWARLRQRLPPNFDHADAIGTFRHPESRAFAELLIDCEEDRVLRAVLVGMLQEGYRVRSPSRSIPTSTRRNFGHLLIDCEENRTLRAVLVGMLRVD
jgi:hypothetical protein